MDGGVDLALEEIQGRNTWMVWSAGNDRFWDWLARQSGGSFDLLKIVSSYDPEKDTQLRGAQREQLKQIYNFRHDNRLATLGVVNEPCYRPGAAMPIRAATACGWIRASSIASRTPSPTKKNIPVCRWVRAGD